MAHYLVRAQPRRERLTDLWTLLESGAIIEMQPFGRALDDSLRRMRLDRDGTAVWEEEDYCVPPLAQERAAVLDEYFDDLTVERVARGDGWTTISGLPHFWSTTVRSES